MMQQEYKRTIEKQHAPESLIQKTLLQMQEEKAGDTKPAKIETFPSKRAGLKGLIAAAGLVIVIGAGIGLSKMGNHVPFYQMEESGGQLNLGLIQMKKQVWTLAEFAEATGWNVEHLEETTDIEVTEGRDGSQVIRAGFCYIDGNTQQALEMLQDQTLSRGRYAGAKPVVISGRDVYFAADDQCWYAFYEEGAKVLITAENSMMQGDFVKVVKEILR